ncbi:MAG: biotin--[acetyl-CoA-carboxylase] ligase [Puniceicoccales bacterium]|jgi:BirA family biotin operon repressor/biotin-[acetyl-CoA-carboxylase] ligase|nr:biotin--[acetyl-CoA-carboxylase] ligase [Puniceicoccales bacterium]
MYGPIDSQPADDVRLATVSQAELERILAELPGGFRAVLLPEVGSTNDVARACLLHGCAAAILAGRQTAGRGRHGRRWIGERLGNIYLSMAIPCRVDGTVPARWSLELARRIANNLLCRFSLPLQVKPPNDLLLDGRKVAGILLESVAGVGMAVGVGMNLVPDPGLQSNCTQPVGSLAQHHIFPIAPILAAIIDAIVGTIGTLQPD